MRQLVINIPENVKEAYIERLASELKKAGFDIGNQQVEKNYEPQIGDFVAFGDDSNEEPFIGIFKEWYCGSRDKILCFAHITDEDSLDEEKEYWNVDDVFRLATEEEKERLIKALARNGRRWNPETQEFEECESYEAIRTFEDALGKVTRLSEGQPGAPEKSNVFSDLLFAYYHIDNHADSSYMTNDTNCDVIAFIKLRIIVAAINDGWMPKFTEDEYRWYPWFYLYTKEEVDAMSEEKRAKLLLVGGLAFNGALCGLAASSSYDGFSYSSAYIGARLAFYDKRRAEYAGQRFLELYRDLNFLPPTEEVTE